MKKQIIPETPANFEKKRIIERPDGFFWQDLETSGLYGPFDTLLDAVNDVEYGEAQQEVGETLAEAEDEIGIAGWMDPDTGEPAEEHTPRFSEG